MVQPNLEVYKDESLYHMDPLTGSAVMGIIGGILNNRQAATNAQLGSTQAQADAIRAQAEAQARIAESQNKGKTGLYIGIGVGALVLIGIIAYVVLKK